MEKFTVIWEKAPISSTIEYLKFWQIPPKYAKPRVLERDSNAWLESPPHKSLLFIKKKLLEYFIF